MCLAVRQALHFAVHLGTLGWARCPFQSEKYSVWKFAADRHKHGKLTLSCQEQPSILTELLTNRKYWLSPCFSGWCFAMLQRSRSDL